ncbi:MAG: PIG-L family deacetylase [Candidatus Woesearchaeota archaeon]|jgi:LmbE family N-acetylglucosaminyl deacetylase
MIKTRTKSLLIGGLLLAFGGNPTLGQKVTDNYQQNGENPSYFESSALSSKKDPSPDKLIILSPHFDDAVLSVGSIISEHHGPKYLLTFFSTPTITPQYLTHWDEMCGFTASVDAREIRTQENVNAAHWLGAKVINMDYVDNQYELRSPLDNSTIVEAIVKDIEKIIESTNGAQVTIIGPSYFGEGFTHPDHLLVSQAFVQVLTTACYANATFYFYEDLPYTHKKFAEEEITLDKLLTDHYQGLHLTKREIFISPQGFNSHLEGIQSYPSQVKAFDNLGEDIISEVGCFEMNRCPQFPLSPKPCEVIYEIR